MGGGRLAESLGRAGVWMDVMIMIMMIWLVAGWV